MSVIFMGAAATYRVCRESYQLILEAAYERAETECNGQLLNERGRAAGIDAFSLFKGNNTRAMAYASRELVDHWARYPRLTFAAYERQWMERENAA